jgi:hypothetical protein
MKFVDLAMTSITIGKFDAARRQLETAIDLWFHEGDAVSTHTLAYAAYELIHYVSKIRNPSRRDLLLDTALVKDEHRKEFARRMKGAANFFKHAREDGEKVFEFDSKLTEGFILFSIVGAELAGERLSVKEKAYLWWFYLDNPKYLSVSRKEMLSKLVPIDKIDDVRGLGKSKFFDMFMQLSKQHNIHSTAARRVR